MSAQIHITRWSRLGSEDPRVVLVHGSTQGSSVGGDRHFSAQARLAMRGFDLLVPDRPGHGRSPDPGRPDDPDADGAWVVDLLGDGAHLVGHSFGGCVALGAAIRRPQAVRSLTLIEPALQHIALDEPEMADWLAAIGRVYATAKSPAELAAGFRRIAGIPAGLLVDHSPGAAAGDDPEELERVGRGLKAARVPQREWIEAALKTVVETEIPLLVVSGGWNPGIDATARKAARLGAGRYEEVSAEHHFPHLVDDRFNDLFAAFIADSATR